MKPRHGSQLGFPRTKGHLNAAVIKKRPETRRQRILVYGTEVLGVDVVSILLGVTAVEVERFIRGDSYPSDAALAILTSKVPDLLSRSLNPVGSVAKDRSDRSRAPSERLESAAQPDSVDVSGIPRIDARR